MLKTIREVLYCAILIVLFAIGTRSLILIGHLDNVVIDVPATVNARLDKLELDTFARVDVGIQDIDGQITDTRTDIKNQIVGLRRDLTGVVLPSILATLDSRMASIQKDANGQLTTLNQTASNTAKPLVSVLKQADNAAPLWLDCEYNPDCAFNRYQGTAKAVEKTMQVIAAEAPKMAASVDSIAASSAGIASSADSTGKEVAFAAKRFNQPQTKMAQIRSWMLTLARMYGAI